ncbi:MAG: IPT/TIG domain-containing protein, partial [Verrucomicrobiota bacterium]
NVQIADTGLYGCVVSNDIANPPLTNNSVVLTVNHLPYNPAALSLVWSLGYSQPNYLTGYGLDRSMISNAASTNLILCHRASTPYVAVLDPLTGALKGSLDESGLISLGYANQFPLNQVAVGDDGVIYSGNMTLTAGSVPYVLYSWQNENASQAVAYSGDPGAPNYPNLRWGDAMAVRGAGINTQILLSSGDANSNSTDTVFSLLTTADGVNFTSKAFMVTNMPGASANVGLTWGPGDNTFFAKSPGFGYAQYSITNQFGQVYTTYPYTNQMYFVQIDTNNGVGSVLKAYPTSAVSGNIGPIGVNLSSNLLAGLEIWENGNYDYVSVYDIADPLGDPVLLGQSVVTYSSLNRPYGGVGGVSFGQIDGTNYVFVLDTQNGIYTYALNENFLSPALPPAITSIVPSSGRTNGGTLVTITGSNFLSGVTVQFGNAAGTGVSLTGSTNITVYTPAGLPGVVDVVVANTDGLSATSVDGFAYVLPPPAATIVPGSVVLSGSLLKMVWLGGTNAACELQSTTSLTPPVIWSPVQTNVVGADGLSTNQITIDPANPAKFFRLAIPYN